MKAGQYIRIGVVTHEHTSDTLAELGESSDEQWARADAAADVTNGKADVVYIVKIIAVARRSAKIED